MVVGVYANRAMLEVEDMGLVAVYGKDIKKCRKGEEIEMMIRPNNRGPGYIFFFSEQCTLTPSPVPLGC